MRSVNEVAATAEKIRRNPHSPKRATSRDLMGPVARPTWLPTNTRATRAATCSGFMSPPLVDVQLGVWAGCFERLGFCECSVKRRPIGPGVARDRSLPDGGHPRVPVLVVTRDRCVA